MLFIIELTSGWYFY